MSETTTKFVPASQTIEVDFLYLDLTTCSRCRASDAALDAAVEIVRPVLDSVGASIEVRKTLVESEEQARALGFVSSPTITVAADQRADERDALDCERCWPISSSPRKVLPGSPKIPHLYAASQDVVDRLSGQSGLRGLPRSCAGGTM